MWLKQTTAAFTMAADIEQDGRVFEIQASLNQKINMAVSIHNGQQSNCYQFNMAAIFQDGRHENIHLLSIASKISRWTMVTSIPSSCQL